MAKLVGALEAPPAIRWRQSGACSAYVVVAVLASSGRRTVASAGRLARSMQFHRSSFRAHAAVVSLILVGACKKGAPPQPAARSEVASSEVSKDSALFFTYVEPSGMFATADKAEKVPEVARRLVRIMGVGKDESHRRNDSNVEVIDVRELLAAGKTQPRVMSREAFESGALAQLPPGDSCPLAGPHGSLLAEDREESGGPDDPPIVILYATQWCKACKAARQYLVSNRIPFTSSV